MLERPEMIKQAERLAVATVEDIAACDDTVYERLIKLPDEQAVKALALDILQDAIVELEDQ